MHQFSGKMKCDQSNTFFGITFFYHATSDLEQVASELESRKMIHEDSQPLRELQWLYNYFRTHGHDRMATEIHEKIRKIRKVAQSSLNQNDASDIVPFTTGDEGSNELG